MDSVFNELYDKYHHDVYKFLFYMTKNKEHAEDLTQEVYIRILKAYSSFEGKSSEKTWIFSIARNVAIDFFRKQKTLKDRIFERFDWAENQLKDMNKLPEDLILQSEELNKLYSFLNLLTVDQRSVVLLRYSHDLSISETAATLNWSESKVKTTQHRAIKKLKDLLNEKKSEVGK